MSAPTSLSRDASPWLTNLSFAAGAVHPEMSGSDGKPHACNLCPAFSLLYTAVPLQSLVAKERHENRAQQTAVGSLGTAGH